MIPSIDDYAIIGDCRAAALVSSSGSIDWLCWPRFDSPSIFAAILDERAGHWAIAPMGRFRSSRRYVPGTNVLKTMFETESGSVVLTDLMPVASEEDKRKHLVPDHQIIRRLECTRGQIDVQMIFEPKLALNDGTIRWRAAGGLGVRAETSTGLLSLHSDAGPMEMFDDGLRCRLRLVEGERRTFSLTFESEWPAVIAPLGEHSEHLIERSIKWWQSWVSKLTYHGPFRDEVVRSALTLKLLVFAPSGAILAAPTTSLPERIGGDLNWDYRFCWLRDAALTMRALMGLGFTAEAEAFLIWLVHSTRLTQPELRVLYDVHGNKPKRERTVTHLTGYRDSLPIRLGNAAIEQTQLDVYGEVIDAAAQFVRHGGLLDRDTQRMLQSFGRYVCRNWNQPDHGIWEPRSGRRHHTHSRVLCWAALDRIIRLERAGLLCGSPLEQMKRHRNQIRDQLRAQAWNERLQSYVSELGGDDVDASLLMMPWYGFEKPSSARMKSTYECIRKRLGASGGLLYRYRTDESAGEGAFGICSFWGAEYLALGGGTSDAAVAELQRLILFGNDVGLFGEEIDPETGSALGNFPQAFTHVGLINAALSLTQRLKHDARAPSRAEVHA